MSKKESLTPILEQDDTWRHAYEVRAIIAWIIALVWVIGLTLTSLIPLLWGIGLMVLTTAFIAIRTYQALRVLTKRAALSGVAMSFMTVEEAVTEAQTDPMNLWIGHGFRWWPEHSQRLYELLKMDWSTLKLPAWLVRLLLGKRILSEDSAGLPIIHGVSDTESILKRPLKNFEGGLCLCGTTQAGKGVYLTHLVTQAIARGDVVIVFDPKHSSRLKDTMLAACRAAGRADPLTFHPAFPDTGVRLDPLASFTNPTEIATRIRAAFPPNMDESFASFAWLAVNAIAQGLIALEIKPTLPLITHHVRLGIDDILEKLLERSAQSHARDGWEKHLGQLAKEAGKPPAPTVSDRLMGLVRLYETEIVHEASDPTIEALIEVFRHNRDHYAKITASLIPVLSILTSGKLGESLSPDVTDLRDTRPIMNLEKVIRGRHVLYIGLDALPNPTVASTLAGIWLSDLANIAGRRYNMGLTGANAPRIALFVDELANVINTPLIEILNKGAESGIYTTCAMQTIADLAHRMGSIEAAHVVLANLNNLIALRTKDQMTQDFVTATLGKTYITNQSVSLSARTSEDLSLDFTGQVNRQMAATLEAVFPSEFLGRLPNCEAIVQVSAGYVYKTRCPILVVTKEKAS